MLLVLSRDARSESVWFWIYIMHWLMSIDVILMYLTIAEYYMKHNWKFRAYLSVRESSLRLHISALLAHRRRSSCYFWRHQTHSHLLDSGYAIAEISLWMTRFGRVPPMTRNPVENIHPSQVTVARVWTCLIKLNEQHEHTNYTAGKLKYYLSYYFH